jgi:hypothetical protein
VYKHKVLFISIVALARLKKANNDQPLKAIVWTSGLTASPKGRQFLNSSSYIIQVWDGM